MPVWKSVKRTCKFWYKNVVLSTTKNLSSLDSNSLDVEFENDVVWGIKSNQTIRIDEKDIKEKKSKEKLDFSNLSHDDDISTAMVEKYSYNFLKKSIDDVWDIEEDIKRFKKSSKSKKNFDIGQFESDDMLDKNINVFGDSEDVDEEGDSLIERVNLRNVENSEGIDVYGLNADEDEKLKDDIEKQHIDSQRRKQYLQDFEEDLVGYKAHNLPLADDKLVDLLREKHVIFYNLLARIQETHANNDLVSAYQIQDRINYLLSNPTLLYKKLAKQLIVYVEKINQKLQTYVDEISTKQQVLKKLNSQLNKLHEHERRTKDSFESAQQRADLMKEKVDEFPNQKPEL